MRPVICLITDGQQRESGGQDLLVRRVGAAARAGIHLVQIRERTLDGGALTRLVTACVATVRGTRTRILVNDRLDVALAAGAHGVHLRADSMAASRVRAVAPPGFLVGRSVHSVEDARRAAADGGLDYLIFGTVFESASKAGRTPAGIEALAEVAAATALPVLAVGGVRAASASLVARAGAAGVAAIGLFARTAEDRLQVLVSELNMAFDTMRTVP